MEFDPTGKDDYRMTSAKAIHRYIRGGRGEVVLYSPTTTKAHMYAFISPKNRTEFPEGTIFVYVVHEGHRIYLGMLSDDEFRLTARSQFLDDTETVKGARYIIKMSLSQKMVDSEMMYLYNTGKCCVCGRSLRSASAFSEGIGRRCLQRYNIRSMKAEWDGN